MAIVELVRARVRPRARARIRPYDSVRRAAALPSDSAAGPAHAWRRGSSGSRPQAGRRASELLLIALAGLLMYAAFAGGASSYPEEARVQVALAALASLTAAGWVWGGPLRASAPRAAWTGIGLLAGFAAWSGVTVLWSVSPNGTWIELNRAIAYVLALLVAVCFGSSHRAPVRSLAAGLRMVVGAVTAYALGQKLVPGLHVAGLFDLNQTSISPRLRAPLDYWNALALFITFGVPPVLAAVLERERSDRSRLRWLLVLPAMLLTIGLTYSRGGLIALALSLMVAVGLGGARLRALVALALAAVATLPALAFALSDPRLVDAGVSLPRREAAGLELTVVLAASLVALWFVGRMLLRRERQSPLSALSSRRIGRALAVIVGTAAACVLVAVAASHRGLPGTVSHAWHSFTSVKSASLYQPNRLLSTDSGNRWVWWKEAAGAFSDRPLQGWGAGSFPVLDLLYRSTPSLRVRQPHDVPLQFLAETGAIGTLLALGGLVLLLAVGVAAARRPAPPERMLAAALLAGAVAYVAHALYDWDWDIPAVTLPALVILGTLAGASARARRPLAAGPPSMPATASVPGPAVGTRLLGIAIVTLVMCLYAASSILPSVAADRAAAALVGAGTTSPPRVRHALATAELASSLDPLADDGLKAAAQIAIAAGELSDARRDLLDAVHRDPSDAGAWQQLANLEAQTGDRHGLQVAATQALALDPRGDSSLKIAQGAIAAQTPPSASATATGTPLPSTGGQ